MAEFGTEINGDWFPWNGKYNGAGTKDDYGDPNLFDGPERFRDTYRHIIDLYNKNGACATTWFFHVDAYSSPNKEWNKIKHYYPEDQYIDWIGVSIYGPQKPKDDYQEFEEIMDDIYPNLKSITNKPVAILEFAITEIK